MTEQKAFKRRVRERTSKTGESYTAARAQVSAKRDRNAAATERLTAAGPPMSDESIRQATGKSWDEWYAVLDAWGGTQHTHTEIARYVSEEHGVDGWWSQGVTVGYERARKMRRKYERPDGFSITATKTVAVPVDVLSEAFADDVERKRWLPEVSLTLRTEQPGKSARFDYEDGTTRVNVWFIDTGESKSTVSMSHERLADADDAETMKAMWKDRLAELKTLMES
jgi:hypothetical protein